MAEAKAKLKLLWISCGNKDGLIRISQNMHKFLKEHEIDHVWHVDEHGHDPVHWSSSLYWFSQSVFQEKPLAGDTNTEASLSETRKVQDEVEVREFVTVSVSERRTYRAFCRVSDQLRKLWSS